MASVGDRGKMVQVQVVSNSSPRCSITNLLLLLCGIGVIFILLYVYSMESFQGFKYVRGVSSTTIDSTFQNQKGGGVELNLAKDSDSSANANNFLRKYFTRSPTKAPTKHAVESVRADTTTVAFSPALTHGPSESFSESVEELTRKVYGGTDCPDNPRRKDLTRIMQAWVDIAKQHKIEYMIFYGSLLGSLRNREVTPYDHDIDVLMNVSYYPLLQKIAPKRGFDNGDGKVRLVVQPDFWNQTNPDLRKRLNCRGKSVTQFTDWCSFQEPMARVLTGSRFMDLAYFYDKGSYLLDLVSKQYAKEDIFPLKPCWLNGVKTYCPNNPKKLLKIYFSSDSLLPPFMCRDGKWKDKYGNIASQLS